MVLTADRDTREPAISQTQSAHYPRAHDNSCLVPAQGQGCNCTYYVMKRRRGGEQRWEGFYRDVSQCIIVHRANRARVTRTGWSLILTDFSISVWLPGGASCWGLQHRVCNCAVLHLKPTKHMFAACHPSFPPISLSLSFLVIPTSSCSSKLMTQLDNDLNNISLNNCSNDLG